MMGRPDLAPSLTKIHCFRLTQFEKCVFLDADCMVLTNIDELFEREAFAAAPDIGWPDCFNSGVFVFRPDLSTFDRLVDMLIENGSFDGADQGLLNELFGASWRHSVEQRLAFGYNMPPSIAVYGYRPAIERFRSEIRIIHFMGDRKPWIVRYEPDTGHVSEVGDGEQGYYRRWWQLLYESVAVDYAKELVGTLTLYL
ncbi:hypothetical protein ACOME3_003959 [Neoechinorhynchus agilis]